MSEANVQIAIDEKNRRRWGIGFFFKQDGKKQTLNSKRAVVFFGLIFTVSYTIMCFRDTGQKAPSQSTFNNGIQTVQSAGAVVIQNVAEKTKTMQQSSQSKKTIPKLGSFGPQVIARPRLSQIPPGTFIAAKLISGASNNLVKAELTENLIVNGEVLAPEHSVLLGNGSSTEERLFVQFSKIVFSDGTSEAVSAQACDFDDKIAGLKGSKVSRQVTKIAGGIGLGFLGGLSDGLQDTDVQNGSVVVRPSLKNAMLKGTATAALEQSKDFLNEIKDKQPIIEVKSGTHIYVIFNEVDQHGDK
jgi:hypothetical protein